MKKKVLFIVGNLQSGGVSKSMISLLNAWNSEKYETSICICCKKDNIWEQHIPSNIKVLYNSIIEHVMGGFRSACWLGIHGHPFLMLGVLLRLVLSQISRSKAALLISKMMPPISQEDYDLIVDYGGQQILYYMVDKLSAKRKATFFHNDYAKWPFYYQTDKNYYPKVDHIFTISKVCENSLKEYFPECTHKISIMENISSPVIIRKLSEEEIEDIDIPSLKENKKTIIVTLAHLCRRKGTDLSIEAMKILTERNIKYHWIFVGKILEPDLIVQMKKNGLLRFASLVGIKQNPYPYLRNTDIYVQPSRYEGKSISLDEAKILCKPIIVTNFSTVSDQFENRVNASICKMNGQDIADKISELIINHKLSQQYTDYLSRHVTDNSNEVDKLYQMIN